MIYETIETIDFAPMEAAESVGANKIQVAVWSIWPQIMKTVFSYFFYAFEINVRGSTVLGYVGAGGIGVTFAGVLAIGIHQIGMLGKLFTEEMEAMDEAPVEACHAVGASGVKTMFFARIPQLLPIYASLILNHFEIGVRSASTLGPVGAGGIGATLIFAIQGRRWDRVSIILLTIIVTVFLLDALTGYIRKKLR